MRFFDDERNTSNSRVYKNAAIRRKLYCPICRPNRGCNTRWQRHMPTKSWKFKTKKRKQWKNS